MSFENLTKDTSSLPCKWWTIYQTWTRHGVFQLHIATRVPRHISSFARQSFTKEIERSIDDRFSLLISMNAGCSFEVDLAVVTNIFRSMIYSKKILESYHLKYSQSLMSNRLLQEVSRRFTEQ